MALVFYVLGTIVTGVGLGWAALVVGTTSQTASGMGVLAAAVVAIPGLATAMSGLLLLAIGGVLSRLDKIVENTSYAPAPRQVDTSRWSRADRERWEQQQR